MLECHLQSLQTRPRARKRGAKSDSSGSKGGEVDFKREAKSYLEDCTCSPRTSAKLVRFKPPQRERAATTPRATPCRSHELVLPGEEGERRPAPSCMLRL